MKRAFFCFLVALVMSGVTYGQTATPPSLGKLHPMKDLDQPLVLADLITTIVMVKMQHLKYPVVTKAERKYGESVLLLTVDSTGTIASGEITTSLGAPFDKEIERVMSFVPGRGWKQPMVNGKAVSTSFEVPFEFDEKLSKQK